MDILEKVVKTIKNHSMLTDGDQVLIGLSGGPDSVCLTAILDKLKDNFNLSLSAVYVDHGLRPGETGNEVGFCEHLCKRFGIKLYSEYVDVKEYARSEKMNLQEAAREMRYNVFRSIAKELGNAKIALAHQREDQAETVLMRLIRGAGRAGLSGILPVRGNIIRPLIEIERREIEKFLCSQTPPIPFISDSSNLRTDYTRNCLRIKVIPEIQKRNPNVISNICRTAEILKDEDDYLEVIVTKVMMRLITRKTPGTIELFLIPLTHMEKPILRRVLRRATGEITGFRGVYFKHIEDIMKLIKEGRTGSMLSLPGGIRVVRRYSTLLVTREAGQELRTRRLQVPGEVFLEECSTLMRAETSRQVEGSCDSIKCAVFDYDRLSLPLNVRMRRAGDYFYPSGFGRKKKLQDFFVDNKVAKELRDTVPLLVTGDDDIMWVAGYRTDERFMPTGATKKFLTVTLLGMEKVSGLC
jgi:tRNA(Ile)-lysidine synthase